MSLRIAEVYSSKRNSSEDYHISIVGRLPEYGSAATEADLTELPKHVRDHLAAALRAVDGDDAPAAKTATAKIEVKAAVITADDLRRLIREEYERVDHSKWSAIFDPGAWSAKALFGDDTPATSLGEAEETPGNRSIWPRFTMGENFWRSTEGSAEVSDPLQRLGKQISEILALTRDVLLRDNETPETSPAGAGDGVTASAATEAPTEAKVPEPPSGQSGTVPFLFGAALDDHIRTLARRELATFDEDVLARLAAAHAAALKALADAGVLPTIPSPQVQPSPWTIADANEMLRQEWDKRLPPYNTGGPIAPDVSLIDNAAAAAESEIPDGATHYVRWRHDDNDTDYYSRARCCPEARLKAHIARREAGGWRLNDSRLWDDNTALVGPRVPEWEL